MAGRHQGGFAALGSSTSSTLSARGLIKDLEIKKFTSNEHSSVTDVEPVGLDGMLLMSTSDLAKTAIRTRHWQLLAAQMGLRRGVMLASGSKAGTALFEKKKSEPPKLTTAAQYPQWRAWWVAETAEVEGNALLWHVAIWKARLSHGAVPDSSQVSHLDVRLCELFGSEHERTSSQEQLLAELVEIF